MEILNKSNPDTEPLKYYSKRFLSLIADKKVTARSFRTLGGYFFTVHILLSIV